MAKAEYLSDGLRKFVQSSTNGRQRCRGTSLGGRSGFRQAIPSIQSLGIRRSGAGFRSALADRSFSRGNSHSQWLRDPNPSRSDLMRRDFFARLNALVWLMRSRLEQSCRSRTCLKLGDSVGSVCQRRSQKLHHIRFSGASLHQADMAVGRSNRKARRDGQWCAVLTRQPASVTVTSETPLRGGLAPGKGDWQSLAVP